MRPSGSPCPPRPGAANADVEVCGRFRTAALSAAVILSLTLGAFALAEPAVADPAAGAAADRAAEAAEAAEAKNGAGAGEHGHDDGGDDDPLGERTGGRATVFATGRNAFSFPAANLTDPERTRFAIGNSFFRRNWVQAPASTKARDGLGPHFNARSCGGCHIQDGRGSPTGYHDGTYEQPVALFLRLSVPGTDAHGGPKPEPVYGDQLSNAAVRDVRPEALLTFREETVNGRFDDGTAYTLRRPVCGVTDLGYGPMAPDVMFSPRVAPQVIGAGLLEAIPEVELERNVRDQAALSGPIRGRLNRVWDVPTQQTRTGRFGWKANVATVAHQTAAAFHGDIGITSKWFPDETCTPTQADCRQAPRGADGKAPEINDELLGQVIFYQATLAPPARRKASDPEVQRGQQLFSELQCAVCHRPSYVTGEPPLAQFSSQALAGQRIWPYTDLLLHDMGEDLADGRPDYLANGRQWRTPPLWGIGLIHDVNGHTRLLHDGRADGVLEAILWHGGEAEASRRAVLGLSAADREALVRFVESL